MVKRTWSEGSESPHTVLQHHRKRSKSEQDGDAEQSSTAVPQISRKVKACAACRKQKIKCIMDDRGPPCRRCTERNLGCVLNKSLQTIIDEKSQFADAYSQDLEMMHHSLQNVLHKVGMAPMAPLHSSRSGSAQPVGGGMNLIDEQLHQPDSPPPSVTTGRPRSRKAGPSCDNSPRINPADGGLSDVPIQSLYALTKLSALRSPDVGESEAKLLLGINGRSDEPLDFISRGAISRERAERLFTLYNDRLDHYMYKIGCPYNTLDEVRAKSPILTASICTVAALHDRDSDEIYGICIDEFRRLMGGCMFDRLINKDSLRAMCIAAYWLSDISWTISGYAIRRAGDVNLSHSFNRVMAAGAGASDSDSDCLRLWYILYICDHHLAILYGRQPIVHDDFSIRGCARFGKTEEDIRLVSQVSLLLIFARMRNIFGQSMEGPLAEEYLGLIANLERELDLWHDTWTVRMRESYEHLGRFPRQGALMHLYFAKLHLYSHVFQGLRDAPIPVAFLPYASSAVTSATSIIKLILAEEAVQTGLNGIPSYLHSVTAFACMFLIKVAIKYGNTLIDREEVTNLITQLVGLFRRTSTGTWHLVHLMEGGLEKMLGILAKVPEKEASSSAAANTALDVVSDNGFSFGALMNMNGQEFPDWGTDMAVSSGEGHNFMDYNIGLSPLLRFDHSTTPGFGGVMGAF